jgi:hypothetical protein
MGGDFADIRSMTVISLQDAEMNRLIAETHNPPVIRNQKEENLFQAEIRAVYEALVESLSPFGEEGDYYGISDFAVRPDLTDRPTVMAPPAPHVRQFAITILTEKFFRSQYLKALRNFLCTDAPRYRIWIDQDFDPNWIQTIVLTADLAQFYCTSAEEATCLTRVLAQL